MSLELMKMYIFIWAHVQWAYIPQCENWNKTNALMNVPKKETHHESDNLNQINQENPRAYLFLPS